MVNQKKFECELQPRPRVEVANNHKKKKKRAYHVDCWSFESNECSYLESMGGIAEHVG